VAPAPAPGRPTLAGVRSPWPPGPASVLARFRPPRPIASIVRFEGGRGSSFAMLVAWPNQPAQVATTPPGHGTVDVTVTTAGGTSEVVSADLYTYS
jgi:hypothetical protein